jgi:hypothetical protein
VKKHTGLCFKWLSTVTGVPDRIVFLNQKVYLVELKTKKGKLSPRQTLVFEELKAAGFPVYVLNSKEKVDEFIEKTTQTN